MTRRRAALPRSGEQDARDGQRRERTRSLSPASREPPPRALTRLSPMVRRLVAPNPSPFTFNGTCTYIVGRGAGRDRRSGPGRRFASRGAARRGRGREGRDDPRHPYPSRSQPRRERSSARRRARGWSAPRRSRPAATARPASIPPMTATIRPTRSSPTASGWQGAGYTIEAVATPGHCSNHLCFALLEENALFSGDHVMAWSTSVVAPPDGSMRAYMASLDKLRGRAETIYWPGHGGPVVEPQRYLRALIHHRRQREASILNALGGRPADDSRARRQDLCRARSRRLTRAAGLSTLAHLEDLGERGLVVAGEAHGRRRDGAIRLA